MKLQFVLSQSNTCLVIEKKKERKKKQTDCRSPTFWLYILACILCCLSALINIHAHVCKKQTLQIVLQIHVWANSLFKLPSKFKGSLWKKKDQRFADVGHVLQCHLACHQTPNHPPLCTSLITDFLMSKKHPPIGVPPKFTANIKTEPRPLQVSHKFRGGGVVKSTI